MGLPCSSVVRARRNSSTRCFGARRYDAMEPLEDRCLLSTVNVAPSFTVGPNITVDEDAGPRKIIGWAGGISPGAASELGQTLSFEIISNSNAGLFDSPPTIAADGTLRFTSKPNAFGVASISTRLRDSGGTANGGVDVSPPQSFTITVNSVNDAPAGIADLYLVRRDTPMTVGPSPDNTFVRFDNGNTLTIADAYFTANGNSGYLNVSIQGSGYNQYRFTFAPPQGQSLEVGSYPDTARWPFQAPYQAGLDITHASSGNNQSHGSFTIRQLEFDPVLRLVADFANSGDTVTLSGTLEYNSTNPSGVLKNDTDADYGTTLSATLVASVAHGQLVFNSNGTFTYAPDPGFVGVDQFSYRPGDGTNDGAETTVQLVVRAINNAPEFAAGPDITILQDAGSQVIPDWATGISAGSPEEASQALAFNIVANDNPALFAQQPVIDPLTGTLSFAAKPHVSGSATISVSLSDDGGTIGGGIDTSDVQTFAITIVPSNQTPQFTRGPNIIVGNNAGTQTILNWATGISPGSAGELSQTLTFNIVANDNPGLFAQQPTIDPLTGTLRFISMSDTIGAASISLSLSDDGGTAHGGVDVSPVQTFTITVSYVNNAPDFVAGPNVTIDEDAGKQIIPNWATNISPGPAGEADQTLAFNIVSNDNTALFSQQPGIDPVTGNLIFTARPEASGTASISVSLRDNGGTAIGGSDTSLVQTFTITILPVDDPPVAADDTYTIYQDQVLQAPADPITYLTFISDQNDFIGQGIHHTWVSNTSAVSAHKTYPSRSAEASIQINFGTWTLCFEAPPGEILTAGTTYDNATRFPFNAGAGLSVSGDGRGSNTLTGRFYIRHIDVDGDTINSFSADFEQHSEGGSAALYGRICYNYVSALSILTNDSDIEGGALTTCLSSGPEHGSIQFNNDGTLVYTPDNGFVGTDRFTYQACDGLNLSKPATVTVNVVANDDTDVPAEGQNPLPCTIRGNVYNDTRNEGSWQRGEKGMPGQFVYLDLNGNGKHNAFEPSVRTNRLGNFVFNILDSGDFTIRVIPPRGWRTSIGQSSQEGFLAEGETSAILRLGLTQQSALVGSAFADSNRNGRWDLGESGPLGRSLFVDLNNNGRLDANETRVIANSTGEFALTGLPAGQYTLCVSARNGSAVKLRSIKLAAGKVTSIPTFGIKPI